MTEHTPLALFREQSPEPDLVAVVPLHLTRGQEAGADEVAGLVREGLVRHVVGDVHVPVGEPETAALRAAAVTALVPRGLAQLGAAVCWEAAAWVYVGGPPPAVVDLAVRPPANRSAGRPPLVVHQMRTTPKDVRLLGRGPLQITTVPRTAVDVARRLPPHEAWAVMDALEREAGLRPTAVLARLQAMQRHRDIGRARSTATAWVARRQSLRPPVTR